MHHKQSNKYFFWTKVTLESVCFTLLMTSFIMATLSMIRVVFVDLNVSIIVDNNISKLN